MRPGRLQAVAFYLLAYGLMNLLAFAALPAADDDVERDRLVNLKGLFHRAPYAALMLAVAMLSLAGIPPFPGFVAKFLIFKNVMAAGHTVYAVLGLVGSYLGIYFYLRLLQFMFMSPDARVAAAAPRRATGTGRKRGVPRRGGADRGLSRLGDRRVLSRRPRCRGKLVRPARRA